MSECLFVVCFWHVICLYTQGATGTLSPYASSFQVSGRLPLSIYLCHRSCTHTLPSPFSLPSRRWLVYPLIGHRPRYVSPVRERIQHFIWTFPLHSKKSVSGPHGVCLVLSGSS